MKVYLERVQLECLAVKHGVIESILNLDLIIEEAVEHLIPHAMHAIMN